MIEILVENLGTEPSEPRPVRIDVAPFGAFVAWRPLTKVMLPGIPPGGRVVLTATGDDELPRSAYEQKRPGRLAMLARVARLLLSPTPTAAAARGFVRALQRESNLEPVKFVGNLDVHVWECSPVERHMQVASGLQAGAENWSHFAIGDGREDSYTLRLEAERDWQVDFKPGSWGRPMHGTHHHVFVRLVPPAHAERGRVAIWVRRASTGLEVPVEFELSARAPERV
jgi:hypothetical protein